MKISQHLAMEEENVRFLPCRESPKEVIEFFNYPKSTVYDQTDELVAEVKRKVKEDGNKSYTIDHRQHHLQGPGLQFVKDSAPAHKSSETQAWLLENLPLPLEPGLIAPSSPYCNPPRLCLLGMVENMTNKHAHNTLDSLRAAIVEEFAI
ncbi:Uncharacterized protein FKW44_014053 [Caligus rogercresseyi]|uniref:Uncharacterized protein n=1 Tax=Caligus rogercresseyi TaxID=217165 RepID=A0A7T8GYF3_CALRO|nr:Uncharacterized protein FKW44_014053 [Caligus rogercresseyi]